MTTAATSLLGLALPVTGELAGTWGDTVNNSITSLLDSAVAGTTTLSTDGDVTLTTTTLAANQARQAILLCSGSRTALRTITAPAQSKIYTIINATTGGYSVKLVGVGPTTGVTIVAGESAVCAWNGSDFIKVSNTGGSASFTNVTVSGTTTLSGLTASTALALNSSKEVVSVTNTGTGNNVLSASPTLTGTVGAAALTLSSDLTLSGGTANGVLYLNGSKVATSGSALTFDGTQFAVKAATTESTNVNIGGGRSGSGYAYLDLVGDSAQASSYSARFIRGNGGANTTTSLIHKGTGAFEFTSSDAGYFTYNINGSEAMRLTSTGLGIGTSSPGAKLDVNGAGIVRGFLTTTDAIKLGGNTSAPSSTDAFIYRPADNTLAFGTASAEQMRLDSSGNLGLGVTPSAWGSRTVMEVGAAGNAFVSGGAGDVYISEGAYYNAGWKYGNSLYAVALYNQYRGTHSWNTAASGTAGNAITFTQAMTLDASGRLGLGVTSPSQVLDMVGNIQVRSSGIFNLNNSDNSNQFYLQNTGSAGGNNANLIFQKTNYGEVARIDSSGNFGLGVTPSAWIGFGKTMEFNNAGCYVGNSGATSMQVGANNYFNGSNYIYSTTNVATRYAQSAGQHIWFTAPSGTAGDAITFTQAMTLDASGRLGISTTSPLNYLDLGATSNGNGVTWSNYSNVFSEYSSGALILSSNYYGNIGSGGYKTAVTATFGAAGIQISGTSGSGTSGLIQFFVDPATSKTAGNAFTPTERARIDSSGNFLFNQSSAGYQNSNSICNDQAGFTTINHIGGTSSGTSFVNFGYGASGIGSITQSGTTAVLYNTTSDQRLKENIVDAPEFGIVIDSIKVRSYDWKADGNHQRAGFVAQELVTVAPEAVHQPADPEQMMAVDYSKLVPMLVKEIQSLRARVAQLESN